MAADPSYNALIHQNQGGSTLTAESGATVDLLSGSTIDIAGTFKVGGSAVTATATQMNTAVTADVAYGIEKVALVASDTAGAVFEFAPGVAFFVQRLVLNITTVATAACTLDCGIGTSGASNDNLIDGVDANAAVGEFCNIKNPGGSGLASGRGTSSQVINGSMKTGAAAGLVGYAYIFWSPI